MVSFTPPSLLSTPLGPLPEGPREHLSTSPTPRYGRVPTMVWRRACPRGCDHDGCPAGTYPKRRRLLATHRLTAGSRNTSRHTATTPAASGKTMSLLSVARFAFRAQAGLSLRGPRGGGLQPPPLWPPDPLTPPLNGYISPPRSSRACPRRGLLGRERCPWVSGELIGAGFPRPREREIPSRDAV
ncbi:MAG: hypothetical protein HW404_1376 [Anaerolineales bacterium]|nr:hypothetical protein [Anaerolineales bacterium]